MQSLCRVLRVPETALFAKTGGKFLKTHPKQLEKKEVGLQQASRAIAWTLFDNRGWLSERVYGEGL